MKLSKTSSIALSCIALAFTQTSVSEPWDFRSTKQARDWSPSNPQGAHIYTVPMGKKLSITDFIMTHNIVTNDLTFRANIGRGPASNGVPCQTRGSLMGPYVSSQETVSINLTSPFVLSEGEQLCLVVGGAYNVQGISSSFVGVLEDI